MRIFLVGGASAATPALVEAAWALGATVEFAETAADLAESTGDTESLDRPGYCAVLDFGARPRGRAERARLVREVSKRGIPVIALQSPDARPDRNELEALFAAGARDVLGIPLQKRELILRLSAVIHRKLRVACIGGGTGLFTVLSALKEVPRILLSSIVTMSDDGGSSGRLRTGFGILPPGDVRRSLVALSNAPEVMNFVMQYRFAHEGELGGHSLGNLLLAALSEYTGGMQGAVKALGDVLNVQGIVMCVTEHATNLCAEFADGRVVRGESAIDSGAWDSRERPSDLRIRRVWHEPGPETSLDVYASLLGADLIVLGPGDLYTSVLAALIVGGVREAIRASRAKRLYVCNLMTKPGETTGYDVADHAAAVVDSLGGDLLDYILVSCTSLEADAKASYAAQAQHPVRTSQGARLHDVTRAELVLRDIGDRSDLVRHDCSKLRAEIMSLIARDRPSLMS